ncbi:MAG: twin-arginine translocation pathway signal protein [Desulfobacula sp.]|nr:twin-arginine translocation pathway signal protein [Desulfobacula sp.]
MAVTGFTGLSTTVLANTKNIGAMMPGKGWLKQGDKCTGDGTPLQFIPKTDPDPDPLKDELNKYKRCPYCGMMRKMWNHSRHLVHYDDDLVDPTCSLHCAAISLSLNLDRGIKAIYAADFGSDNKIKPMINVDKVTYLAGSDLPGTMTKQSKMAFSSQKAALAANKSHGGELVDFEKALTKAYLSMASDTAMIRKKRAAKRKKMK